jgi:quercetin dioxygenase-like cupin family protein
MEYGSAVIIDDLTTLAFDSPTEAAAAVYDRPIGLHLLHEDPVSGGEHYLVRYPPGLHGRPHQHSAAHTIVVLDGMLEANGQIIGPHAYAHFPAGQTMRHQSAGEAPCLFVIIFHGPFDVRVIDDPAQNHGPWPKLIAPPEADRTSAG